MAKHGKPACSRSDLLTQRDAALAENERLRQELHNKFNELQALADKNQELASQVEKLNARLQAAGDRNQEFADQIEKMNAQLRQLIAPPAAETPADRTENIEAAPSDAQGSVVVAPPATQGGVQ